MEKKNKLLNIGAISLILILAIILIGLLVGIKFINKTSDESENLQIITESSDIKIEYTEDELSGDYSSEYSAKITLSDDKISVEGSGVTSSGNTVTITKAGTYYITGTISDGNIVINADKSDEVQLVLDNCNITSKTTAAINGIKCGKLTITLADGSKNTITDAEKYTTFTDTENEEPDATIFTKTDLIINGNGSLTVNANYNDAIASKDGLKIINANITINSADDGIRGKDYVVINNAQITIKSEGDGIKSTNDTDTSLGYIVIEGGSINITAGADGVQAETVLNISEDAVINIKTEGEVSSSSQNTGFGWFNQTSSSSSSSDSSSSKGLKAGTEITIESGTINITSTDDAIHSNGIVIINGGTFAISAGDDGIHADTNIVINNGSINITKSYEGIESSYIEINGGEIKVVASDDGVNVAGGNDSSATNGRMGQNNFTSTSSSNNKLVINGGNITVNSTGDGLDANGSLYINGGTIVVAGPTSSGNGPLDYDGEFVLTGGNLIIYGSTGMWQNPSNSSTQYSLTFSASGKASDEVVLKDSSGNTVVSFTAEKAYGAVLISNSNLKNKETYTLYVNGTSVGSIEVTSVVNSNGNFGGMQGGMGGGMPSGTQGGGRRGF